MGKLLAVSAIALTLLLLTKAAFIVYGHVSWQHDNNWETQGLDTVEVIQSGQNPYSESVYAEGPMIYTMYTPLYYYVCSLFPTPADSPYYFSQLVSVFATIAILTAIVLARPLSTRRDWHWHFLSGPSCY